MHLAASSPLRACTFLLPDGQTDYPFNFLLFCFRADGFCSAIASSFVRSWYRVVPMQRPNSPNSSVLIGLKCFKAVATGVNRSY